MMIQNKYEWKQKRGQMSGSPIHLQERNDNKTIYKHMNNVNENMEISWCKTSKTTKMKIYNKN